MSFTDTILAAEEDFTVYRGDTLPIVLYFYEDEQNTIPYDLSVWTELEMQVRDQKESLDPVITLDLVSGLSVSTNELTISLTATQMNLIKEKYYYDIQGTTGTTVGTVLRGRWANINDVTR